MALRVPLARALAAALLWLAVAPAAAQPAGPTPPAGLAQPAEPTPALDEAPVASEPAGPNAAPTDAQPASSSSAPDAAVVYERPLLPAEMAEPPMPEGSMKIVYVLERVEIRGNRTSAATILRFVPFAPGDPLDVDDPEIERIRYRLLGTGWFNEVRLSLARGHARGHVVLVVEVKERNTITISRVIAGLARVVGSSGDRHPKLRPYGGIGLAESNLFGLGMGLSASGVASSDQAGADLRYHDPLRLGGGFDLTGRVFYNHAREFFGRKPLVAIECPAPTVDMPEPDPCDPDVLAERAVVIYDRVGLGVGTGHEVTSALRYELDWLGELVDVRAKPRAASTVSGEENQERLPIDFHIDDAMSRVSSLRLGLIFDRRDDPALPMRGQLVRFDARVGTGLLGSTYDFARVEVSARHFQRLPWRHTLSLGAMFGTVLGRAPFFYRFYAADLSDLLPSRALELNLDHRRTHNLLSTSVQDFDKADLAARIDFEYQLPIHRDATSALRGVDAYAGAGLFLLAERAALRARPPGYEGLERVPVDLTFDLGVQADTTIGVFKLGFSSLIGFLPDLGQENR